MNTNFTHGDRVRYTGPLHNRRGQAGIVECFIPNRKTVQLKFDDGAHCDVFPTNLENEVAQ